MQEDLIRRSKKTKINEGYLIPIFKQGDKKRCINNRGVRVKSPILKLFSKNLENRREHEYEEIDEHNGF